MRGRNIAKAYAITTLKWPETILDEDGGIKLYRRKFGSKILEVVVEVGKNKFTIITLYWL